MKIFHRALAMVLALIMSFAVLPLGVFASEPWIKVDSETQTPSNPDDPEKSLVIKINADKLAEILKSGISGDTLAEIKSGIDIDIAALLEVFTIDEILEIVPADAILNNIDMDALLNELGADTAVEYFDLQKLLKEVIYDEHGAMRYYTDNGEEKPIIDKFLNKDAAVDAIMSYYKNTADGLEGLLEELLEAGYTDLDECPIFVMDLAHADFWKGDNERFFNGDELVKIEFEKYITANSAGEPGKVTIDHLLDVHWPKIPGTGAYDVSFLHEENVNVTAFIKAMDAAGKDLSAYILNISALLDDPDAAHLVDIVEADPMAYLTAQGQTNTQTWLDAKDDWDVDADFNKTALANKFTGGDVDALASYFSANEDEVVAEIKANPGAYLSADTLDELLEAMASHIDFIKVLNLAEAEPDHSYMYDYINLTKMLQENVAFLLEGDNINTLLTAAGRNEIHTHIDDVYHLATNDIGLEAIIEKEGLETVVGCLNLGAVMDAINDPANGVSLAQFVNLPRAIEVLTLEKIVSIIADVDANISTIIDIDAFIAEAGHENMLKELDADEISEIWKLNAIKDAMVALYELLVSKILFAVNKIDIDGNVIAAETDPTTTAGPLVFDVNAMIAEIVKRIPTLEDIATLEDQTLLSFNVGLSYLSIEEDEKGEAGVETSKKFGVKFVLDGDVDKVKDAAAKANEKVSEFLTYEITTNETNDISVTLDAIIPEKLADLYSEALTKVDAADRNRLLALLDASQTVNEFINNFDIEDVKLILDTVDVETLRDKLMGISATKSLLEKLADKLGKDISALTKDEIIDMIEEKFAEVKEKALSIIDRISSLIPDLLNKPISEMYQGDGKFSLLQETEKTVELKDIVDKLADKLLADKFELSEDMLNYIRSFFPEEVTLNAKLDADITLMNVYKVTYNNPVGDPFTTFLPAGAALSVYSYHPGGDYTFNDQWYIYDGEKDVIVSTVTGDMTVNPVLKDANLVTIYFEFYNGTKTVREKIEIDKKIFPKINAMVSRYDSIAKPTSADWMFVYKTDRAICDLIMDYNLGAYWYDSANDVKLNMTLIEPVDGMVFTPVFAKDYHDKVYGEYTSFDRNIGYTIEKDSLLSAPVTVTIADTLINTVYSVVLSDPQNGAEIVIPNDTLDQLRALQADGTVALKYAPNAEFEDGYYHEGNAYQYTFDFLFVTDSEEKSYRELTDANFEEAVSIKVPFAADQTAQTHVYYTSGAYADGDWTRKLIENAVVENGFVSFNAVHFSNYVIANEYELKYQFISQNKPEDVLAGTIGINNGMTVYLPANIETTITLTPEVTSHNNYRVLKAYVTIDSFDGNKVVEDFTDWKLNAPANVAQTLYLTVVAEYAVTYQVTFKYAGVDTTFTVLHGDKINGTVDTENFFSFVNNIGTEYAFSKWVDAFGNDLTYDPFNTAITADITYIGRTTVANTFYNVVFNNENEVFRSLWVMAGKTVADGVWLKDGNALAAYDMTKFINPEKTSDDADIQYQFSAWVDGNNAAVNIMAAVVDAPAVYSAAYTTLYRVSFVFDDEEGTLIRDIWVAANGTVKADDEYVADAPVKTEYEGLDQYLFEYAFKCWTLNGAEFDLETPITEATELVASFNKNYFIDAYNDAIKDQISAEYNGSTYVIRVDQSIKTINLPNNIKAYLAAAGADAKIEICLMNQDGTVEYKVLTVASEMLNKLYADAEKVTVTYQAPEEFPEGSIYNANNAIAFEVLFECDEEVYVFDEDDAVTIRVPFAWISGDDSDTGRTVMYQWIDGALVAVENRNGKKITQANALKVLEIKLVGGNVLIVANEYRLRDGGATYGTDAKLPEDAPAAEATIGGFAADGYYVAGATVGLIPQKVMAGYKVAYIYYMDEVDGKEVEVKLEKISDAKWQLIVPDHAVELKAMLVPAEYQINYYILVDGQYVAVEEYVYDAYMLADPEVDVVADHLKVLEEILAAEDLYIPTAYEIDEWVGYDEGLIGQVNMDVYLTYKPIDYTLNFVDADGSVLGTVVFNAETENVEFVIPAKEGHTGACPDLATFDIQAAIAKMIEEETTSVSLEVIYTPNTYSITYNEAEVSVSGDAIYGNTVTLEVVEKEYHKATVEVITVNGKKITVKDGAFTMPDADVKVVVTYTPTGNTVYYINNRPCYGAMIGDVVTFEVRFTKGYRLASISDGCTLVNSKFENDMYILVYSFDVTDGRRIEYAIEEIDYNDKNIINGSEHQGSGKPVVGEDNVTFEGWSANLLGSISFAIFGTEDASCVIWLWILLAVIVLVAVLAILYKLFTLGKLKNNFITRFVAWIVSGFLAVCRFVAAIGLGILRIFGKKEKNCDCSAAEEPAEENGKDNEPGDNA